MIICEYKYKVKPHFVMYPTLRPGEFISLRSISFDEILQNVKTWDKHTALIKSSELSRLVDLTDNEMIVRQINCSFILDRVLHDRIKTQKYDLISTNHEV